MANQATINTTVKSNGTINTTVSTSTTIHSTVTGGGVGPQGPAGATGATGAIGATGPQGPAGTGDMNKATYDPNSKSADAFNMDNMTQGTTNKFMTAAEKTVLDNTSGVNTGDQTISDATITTSDITTNNASTSKHGFLKKLDGTTTNFMRGDGTWAAPAGGGDMVLASVQTVTGAKTYNAGKLLDKGEIVFDVKAYGAVGDGTTDDTAAIQSAVDAAHTAGGGVVHFPAGTYKLVTNPIKLYSGTTPTIVAYSDITLRGVGGDAVSGTIVKQTTTGVDVIKGLNDAANGAQSLNISIRDLALQWGTATKTNSGNGIYLAQQAANGPAFQQWRIEGVTASGFQGTGKYGFNFESIITSTITTCQAVDCANGFFFNGSISGNYSSVNTSVTLINCYANMSANAVNGYRINDSTYMSLVGCACDIGGNMAGAAYLVEGCASVNFTGCGFELNGTATLAAGFKFAADAASNASSQVGIQNCYGFQSKSTVEIFVTGGSTGVTLIGYQSNSTISGSTGLEVDAAAQATEIDCSWGSVATNYNFATTAIWRLPGKIRTQTTASSATPTPNAGITDEYDITALAAAAAFGNPTGTPSNGHKMLIRIKDNGTAHALTWGTAYVASGVASLPTTTVVSKTHSFLFVYNSTTSKWVLLAADATGY